MPPMHSLRLRAAALLAASLALGGSPARAAGPSFAVDSITDEHDLTPGDGLCKTASDTCTLRAAVEEANTTSDAVVAIPAFSIPLSISDLLVTSSMTIRGAGMRSTAISAAPASRILTLSVSSIHLTVSDLTLQDGSLTSGAGGAAALTGPASLSMERVLITNCSAPYAGALYTTGDLALTDSVIDTCHATKAGGVGGTGGAIYVGPSGSGTALATLERCTLHGNTSVAEGGAIHLLAGYGFLDLKNCTVSGSNAGGAGGAFRVEGGTLDLDHVTVTDNLSNVFAGGGGISNTAGASAANLSNSILAGNLDVNGQLLVDGDCAGAITSVVCNVIGPSGTSHCSVSGTFTAAAPSFGPLQDNGGLTPTHALLAGSPGVDFATCLTFHPVLTDQRGVQRVGSHADLGAYERAPCGDVNGDGAVGVSDVFYLINALFAGGPVPPGLANVNGDSARNVSDVFYLINALFAGGPAPVCPGT